MKHLLEYDSIRLVLDSRPVLTEIFMRCETGKIVGLLGRNGQGKTCLFNIVYGVLPAARSVRIDKVCIVQPFKRPELIRYLPQFNFLPGHLTVKRVFADFELDFSELEHRFPEFRPAYHARLKSLSGGELRFIEIYLILRSATQFVVLDEPFTHLMPIQVEKMSELIQEEKERKGILLTDQLYEYVNAVCDELYVLSNGKTQLIKDRSSIYNSYTL